MLSRRLYRRKKLSVSSEQSSIEGIATSEGGFGMGAYFLALFHSYDLCYNLHWSYPMKLVVLYPLTRRFDGKEDTSQYFHRRN